MSNVKNIASWIAILLYTVVALSMVSAKRHDTSCSKIEVNISDKSTNSFVSESDVLGMLKNKGQGFLNTPIESINTNDLEEIIQVHPSVNKADVYRKITGELEIQISQRKPLLRVINNAGESYYIDDEGYVMPLSSKYTAHVLVASGNIHASYAKWSKINLREPDTTIVNKSNKVLLDLLQLADYIYQDNFWQAQIEQIYVHGKEYELIPRVGTQLILFGDLSNINQKFNKLKALYEQGMPQVGWNKYKTINLKYNNQVICTKR